MIANRAFISFKAISIALPLPLSLPNNRMYTIDTCFQRFRVVNPTII